jgi:hypothetical protein
MTTAILRTHRRALFTAALALAVAMPQLAQAAPRSGVYAVTLAAPLEQPRREVVEGALWRCDGERCSAPADGERMQALCGKLARRVGEVARFAGPQGELTAEDLARCNSAVPLSRSSRAGAAPLQAALPK